MTNWELFHAYRHLVEADKVKPLVCPTCESDLVTRIGADDEPVLWCYGCMSILRPGLDLLAQIRAVVKEHTND